MGENMEQLSWKGGAAVKGQKMPNICKGSILAQLDI